MEHIVTPKVENVLLLDNLNSRNSSEGTLYITTTHLIFVSPEQKEECGFCTCTSMWWRNYLSQLLEVL